jgi:hypothetical protein
MRGRPRHETRETSDAPDQECTVQDLVELIGQQQRVLQDTLSRHHIGKPRRELRVVRLRWTNWVLSGALVLGMVLFGFLLFDNWEHRFLGVGLVLAPAALGGTLSRIRTLRDEPLVSRSGEQPRYRAAFVAQLLVSGALGLILLGLAAMDFLPGLEPAQGEGPGAPLGQNVFEGNNPLIFALYAFLAGYSEPWTFNILQRALPAGGAI